jgi:ferredoxin
MSLEVHAMVLNERMENSECIPCGAYVDVCPHRVIRYDFGRPRPVNPVQTEKP